ncbi:MAG: oligosaccharide flippase family protein [Candidatus Humimicrobiaceae bacterium]
MDFKNFFFKYFNLTAKNLGFIFITSSLANIINFFYQIIMGRILGPSGYGELNTLISLLFISGAITGTFQTSVTRYISAYNAHNDVYKIKNFFIKITIRFFILSCLIFIILLLLLKLITSFLNMQSSLPLIILGVIIVQGSLASVVTGVIQGMGRFKALGFNSILSTSLKLVLGIFFIYLGFKSFGAVIGIMLAALIAYLILFLSIKDILRLKIQNNIDSSIDIKNFYKSTMMILISTVLVTLISYFDIVLVKHFFSSENAGYFAAASQIGRIILFFPGAIGIVIFPRFTEKFEKNERLRGTFLKSYFILLVTSIFFLVIYFFFPEIIIKIMYGTVFINDSSKLIFLYGLFMALIGFINLQIFYFISMKKYWYLICLFIFFVVEIVLIVNYHNTLKSVLWIEILISSLIFFVNTIIMLILSNRRRILKHG